MEKILVPTDFSSTAEYGLKVATALAAPIEAEIHLLNVIYPVQGTTFSAYGDINNIPRTQEDRFMVELVRKNEQRMQALIEEYERPEFKINPVFDFEDKVNGINHFIKEHQIDLVVIGTTESKSLADYVFGSHTEKVIKASECPVISVRNKHDNFYPKNIVLALDVKNELYHGIEYIRDFAKKYNSKLHMLYVMDDGVETDEAVQKIENVCADFGISNYTINTLSDKNAEMSIKKFAKRQNADMLSLISHGRKGIGSMIFGSVTNDVINDSEIPVMVVNKNID